MRPAGKFWKNMCLIACIPSSPKLNIYWPFILPLWSSFSGLFEVLSPRPQSSLCPKQQTCSSNVVHFFFVNKTKTSSMMCLAAFSPSLCLVIFCLVIKLTWVYLTCENELPDKRTLHWGRVKEKALALIKDLLQIYFILCLLLLQIF